MMAFVVLVGAVFVLTGWSGIPGKFFNWAGAYAASGPGWARGVAVVAGVLMVVVPIWLFLRSCLAGWHSMWSIRLHPRHKYPMLVRRDELPFRWFIALPEAAEIARERTADLPVAKIARAVCDDGKVSVLSYYAGLLCDADWITLYGCPGNSRRLEKIGLAELKRAQFVDDGAALARRSDREPIYTRVHMCRRELNRRLKQLVAVRAS